MHIIILGAGPSGLTTALSLSKLSPAPKITLLEVRPTPATIGGTINVTPLAIRYLDSLGRPAAAVSRRIRENSTSLDHGLDYVSWRTGGRLGNIWGGIGGLRVRRGEIVEGLLRGVDEINNNKNNNKEEEDEETKRIDIRWGIKVSKIDGRHRRRRHNNQGQEDQGVKLWFHGSEETLEGDVLLGCDGIHSAARKLYVEPERKPTYTGRVVVMGFVDKKDEKPPLVLPDGSAALVDTALVSSREGVLLASYYEPTRAKIYLAQVAYMDEPETAAKNGDARDGWKLRGGDEMALKREIMECYENGGKEEKVKGLQELLARCDSWHLYPCYVLPGEGRWYKDNVLLLGDAAHAMPPQGESTGLAIEDGILLAHVFSRWETRGVDKMLADFELLRKPVIDKYYSDSLWAMKYGFVKSGWFMSVVREWGIWAYLLITRWRQQDHFAGDVRELELPA